METYNNFNFSNRGINRTEQIEEDKSARIARRKERREERREKKFSDEGKDFNLNAFMDALSSLKNSIISKLTDCDIKIADKESIGKKTAEKFKPIFDVHFAKVAALLGEAQYRKNRGEGRKMEKGTEDETTIKTFRETYAEVVEDFTDTSKKYEDEIGTLMKSDIKKLGFKDIEKPLASANSIFIESDSLLVDLLKKIQGTGSQQGSKSQSGPTGSDSKKSDIKIEKPISGTPTGENAELAKKVYALICEKWKDSKTLTETPQWKASGFCKPNKLLIGPNRSAVIKAIKAYYGLDDKSGNITQELVNKLSSSASVNENRSYKELNEGKLLSFVDFVKAKSIYEAEGGIDALKKSLASSNSGSGSSNKSSSGNKESVFKSKEEGNDFRKWVNEKHPDWAKENKLDASGSHTNSFIMKAWEKFKDDYKKSDSKEVDNSKDNDKKDATIDSAKIEDIALNIFKAMCGTYEDEDRVYGEIKRLETKEEFKALEDVWNGMKISRIELDKPESSWKNYTVEKMKKRNEGNTGLSLEKLFKKYFNDGEINRLNSYLPDGVKKI